MTAASICLACTLQRHHQCPGCDCPDHDPVRRTATAFAVYVAELRDLVTDATYADLVPALERLAAVTDVSVPPPLDGREGPR